MTRQEIDSAVKSAFLKELPQLNNVQFDQSFRDLNIDSLTRTMLVFRIEEEFKEDFSDLNLFSCQSLQEISDSIYQLKQK